MQNLQVSISRYLVYLMPKSTPVVALSLETFNTMVIVKVLSPNFQANWELTWFVPRCQSQIPCQILSTDAFCRVRHVKCDEARPGCRKCAQTGRQCDGYAHCTPSPSNKTSTITYSIIPKSLSDVAYRLPPTIPDFLPPSLSASDQEHHSFRFFHAQTAPQLGSFFGSKFWNHFVLKASHHEPAVRHAAIALGSLHERFELKDVFVPRINEDAEENSFALQQYVKAINCLVRPDMSADNKHTHRSANVALTTCILFICFEVSTTAMTAEVFHRLDIS